MIVVLRRVHAGAGAATGAGGTLARSAGAALAAGAGIAAGAAVIVVRAGVNAVAGAFGPPRETDTLAVGAGPRGPAGIAAGTTMGGVGAKVSAELAAWLGGRKAVDLTILTPAVNTALKQLAAPRATGEPPVAAGASGTLLMAGAGVAAAAAMVVGGLRVDALAVARDQVPFAALTPAMPTLQSGTTRPAPAAGVAGSNARGGRIAGVEQRQAAAKEDAGDGADGAAARREARRQSVGPGVEAIAVHVTSSIPCAPDSPCRDFRRLPSRPRERPEPTSSLSTRSRSDRTAPHSR